MSCPLSRIEVYHGDTKIHTLDNEALTIHVREVLTNGIGTFNFSLNTKIGDNYKYSDINVNDTIKIYTAYDTIPSVPLTVGKICRISTPLTIDSGFIRIFEGKNQGEILERITKTKYFGSSLVGMEASAIATEVATDLDLGISEIEPDPTEVTMFVNCESCLDILKKLSDYWYSSESQVKKDFYVDVNNNLVWKSRPLRTNNVETLTIGTNIKSYMVLQDIQTVKNHIKVYGVQDNPDDANNPTYAKMPDDDNWCESLDYWDTYAEGYGTLSLEESDKQVGNSSIKGLSELQGDGKYDLWITRTLQTEETNIQCVANQSNNSYGRLHFYIKPIASPAYKTVWIWLLRSDGDIANWTYTSVEANIWTERTFLFGQSNYGINWISGNDPAYFSNIDMVAFGLADETNQDSLLIDDLYFFDGRFRSLAEDATSQAVYGRRDIEYVDNNLKSYAECQSRAQTLLYQMKDHPTRIDMEIIGNTNVKIGDRLPIVIPAENINANFDILQVDYDIITGIGFINKVTAINSENIRRLPSITPNEAILKQFDIQKEVAKGIQIIK